MRPANSRCRCSREGAESPDRLTFTAGKCGYHARVKPSLERLRDRLYLLVTASTADSSHYWAMRERPDAARRQPPVPVRTAKLLSSLAQSHRTAVVYGAVGAAVALVDSGCSVTHFESDPGRAFGAEFLLTPAQKPSLTSVVIDRGHGSGRSDYVHSYETLTDPPRLVVVGGRSRTAVTRVVCESAPAGSTVVVVRGGRERYQSLRTSLAEAGRKFVLHAGPSADGSARRTTAIVITV